MGGAHHEAAGAEPWSDPARWADRWTARRTAWDVARHPARYAARYPARDAGPGAFRGASRGAPRPDARGLVAPLRRRSAHAAQPRLGARSRRGRRRVGPAPVLRRLDDPHLPLADPGDLAAPGSDPSPVALVPRRHDPAPARPGPTPWSGAAQAPHRVDHRRAHVAAR